MMHQDNQLSMPSEDQQQEVKIDKVTIRNAQIRAMFSELSKLRAQDKRKYRIEFLFDRLGCEFYLSAESISKIVKQDTVQMPAYQDCSYVYKQVFDANHHVRKNGVKVLESLL